MHLNSSGDWAVAGTGRVKLDHQKSYTLTGFARVKAGRVQIKIDYFHGDQRMGHVMSDDVLADADNPKWRKLKVTAGRTDLSDASHIGIGVVAMGDTEAFIDDLVLSVK
jgi:hypothetical protein